MKTMKFTVLIFFLFMAVGIFATPANDFLEITAQLCHLSEPKERCYCSEAGEETILFIEKECFGK